MQECKNIKPRNSDGQPHGYWEWYWPNGNLWYKGTHLNGQAHGYWEVYYYNGTLNYKAFYARM